MSNPFDDLDSALSEHDADENDATIETGPAPTEETEPPAEERDPILEPAFGFDAVKQSPIYARESSWDAFDDAVAEQSLRARLDHEIRNSEKREWHDAALRVAAAEPEKLLSAFLEARKETE